MPTPKRRTRTRFRPGSAADLLTRPNSSLKERAYASALFAHCPSDLKIDPDTTKHWTPSLTQIFKQAYTHEVNMKRLEGRTTMGSASTTKLYYRKGSVVSPSGARPSPSILAQVKSIPTSMHKPILAQKAKAMVHAFHAIHAMKDKRGTGAQLLDRPATAPSTPASMLPGRRARRWGRAGARRGPAPVR